MDTKELAMFPKGTLFCFAALILMGTRTRAHESSTSHALTTLLAAAVGEPAAGVADESDAEKPAAGEEVRKNDPLQQRLDAALAEYNPSIAKAIDELAHEIEEEFTRATKKGDIALARKCKAAEEALRERGSPPNDDFLKHARENAYRQITRAGAKMAAEFEAVAKECLKSGDLERAENVLSEKAELLAEMRVWKTRKADAAAARMPARRDSAQDQGRDDVARVGEKIEIEMVTVGDPGNEPDANGHGAVDYEYRIGKYEITIAQYAAFLNSVAKTDEFRLYENMMANDKRIAGIARRGTPGKFVYVVMDNDGHSGDRPVCIVSWFSAARFANWMHNGQRSGSTETGAYTLNGVMQGTEGIQRNADARFWIPTLDEWYKAAYYDPSKTDGRGGYWTFPTRSDVSPGNQVGATPNQINGDKNNRWAVNPDQPDANKLSSVGAFKGSASAYGTFDQGGNVFEWTDEVVQPGKRVLRGGCFRNAADIETSSNSDVIEFEADSKNWYCGFRLAAPAER